MSENIDIHVRVVADIDDAIQKTQTLDNNLKAVQEDAKQTGEAVSAVDIQQPRNQEDVDFVAKMQSQLLALQQEIKNTGLNFQSLFPDLQSVINPFVSQLSKSVQTINKSLDSVAAGNFSEKIKTRLMDQLITARQSFDRIMDFKSNIQKQLSFATEKELSSLLMAQPQFDKVISRYNVNTRHTGTVNELVEAVMQNQMINQKVLPQIFSNGALEDAQRRAIARMMVVRSGKFQASDTRDMLRDFGFKDVLGDMHVFDRIPESLQKAYKMYGHTGAASGSGLNFTTGVSSDVVHAFRELVRAGNQAAIQAGLSSGMIRMNNGMIDFGKVNIGQWSKMAGIVGQRFADTKTGLPFMWIDRNDVNQQSRLLARQGNTEQELEELMQVIARQKSFVADADIDSKYLSFVKADNVQQAKINGGWNPVQYIIPNTRMDKQTGKLVYIDPQTQVAPENRQAIILRQMRGEERPDDPFVTMGSSIITQFLGMNGNNTFGYGRDASGRPIARAPFFVKMNTQGAYGDVTVKDEHGQKTTMTAVTDAQLNKLQEDVANRKINPMFGDEEYTYAWAAQHGRMLMNKNIYDIVFGKNKISEDDFQKYAKTFGDDEFGKATFNRLREQGERLRQQGLTDVLTGFMKSDFFAQMSATEQQKFLDAGRKIATPGISYKELGFKGTPKTAMVDMGAIYDWFGIDPTNAFMRHQPRIDGVSFVMPNWLPSGLSSQMRGGFGWAKFVGQAEDWTKGFSETGLLDKAYQSGKYKYLFDMGEGEAPAFWMPMMGLSKQELEDLRQELETQQKIIDTTTSQEEKQAAIAKRAELREKKMYNIMDADAASGRGYQMLLTDSSVKLGTKFAKVKTEDFNLMFKGQQGRKEEDGYTYLTAQQQRQLFETVTDLTGLEAVRMSPDFEKTSDYIPASLAIALGSDVRLKELSDKNYDQAISRLKTREGKREFLETLPQGRKLLQQYQETWEDQDAAKRLIENQIKTYQQNQLEGHLYMPKQMHQGLSGVMPGHTQYTLFGPDSVFKFGLGDIKPGAMKSFIEQAVAGNIIANGAQEGTVIAQRMPASENIAAENISSEIITEQLRKIGADTNMTYLTPQQQFKLMTGDFDGDTTWVFSDIQHHLAARVRSYQNQLHEARIKLEEEAGEQTKEEGIKQATIGEANTRKDVNFTNAQRLMGLYSAQIRNAMVGWTEDDNKWLAIAEGINNYDKATSDMMKLGIIPKSGSRAEKAGYEGAIAKRLIEQVNALNRGADVKNIGIFRTNFPMASDQDEVFDVFSAFRERRKGGQKGTVFADALNEYIDKTYDYYSPAGKQARQYAKIFNNMVTGTRLATQQDIAQAYNDLQEWRQDLDKRKFAGESGEEFDNEYAQMNAYARRLETLTKNGLTERNVKSALVDSHKTLKFWKEEQARLSSGDNTLKEKTFKQIVSATDAPLSLKDGVATLTQEQTDQYANYIEGRIAQYSGLITAYEEMLKPVDPILATLEGLDDEAKKEYEEEIQRRKADLKTKPSGSIVPHTTEDLRRILKVESAGSRTRMNWSDVTPWLWEVLNNEKFMLHNVTGYDIETGEAIKSWEDVPFKPYPYGASYEERMRQKAMVQARELNQVVGYQYVPKHEESGHTIAGNYRHDAFEQYYLSDRSQSPEELLKAEVLSGKEDLAKNGVDVALLDTGELKFSPIEGLSGDDLDSANKVIQGLVGALGQFDDAQKTYNNGTMQKFVRYLERQGEQVVHMEGKNYDANMNPMNDKEWESRGAKIDYENVRTKPDGTKEQAHATFAPDLITRDAKTGQYIMYDYKTGEMGALDSLIQMYKYASDIMIKAGQEGADKNGWTQFMNSDGTLNFKELRAYDTTQGMMIPIQFDQDIMKQLEQHNITARANKQQEMESGADAGVEFIEEVIRKKYGEGFLSKGQTNKQTLAMSGSPQARFDYLTHQYAEDQDTIEQISSQLYRERLKRENVAGGGYNRYASMQRQLENTLSDETLAALREQITDPTGLALLYALQTKKARALADLDTAEKEYTVSGWSDVNASIRKELFGVESSSPTDQIFKIVSQMNGIRKTREDMYTKHYNTETGQWDDKRYEDAYKQQLEEEAKQMQFFNENAPIFAESAMRANTAKLDKLFVQNKQFNPEEHLQDAYAKKIQEIQKFIQEQDAIIENATKELAATISETQDEKTLTGNARTIVENIKKRAEEDKARAIDSLQGDAYKEVLREEEARLGMEGKQPEQNAKEWYEQRKKVIMDKYKNGMIEGSLKDAALINQDIKRQSELMERAETYRRNEPIDNLERLLNGTGLSVRQKAQMSADAQRAEATDLLRRYAQFKRLENGKETEDEGYKRLLSLVGNDAQWDNLADRIEAESMRQQEMAHNRSLYQLEQTQSQIDMMNWQRMAPKFALTNLGRQVNARMSQAYMANGQMEQTRAQIVANDREIAQLQAEMARQDTSSLRRQQIMDEINKREAERERMQGMLYGQSTMAAGGGTFGKMFGSINRQLSSHHESLRTQYNARKALEDARASGDNERIAAMQKAFDSQNFKNPEKSLQDLDKEMNNTTMAMNAFSTVGSVMSGTIGAISDSVSRLASQFGRRIFMNAIREATQFVKQYDTAMRQIQAITYKSDEEMASIRQGTIQQAIALRTSPQNVAQVKTELYRQGLSDAEVEDRSTAILKFATVTGTKVKTATKIITTALQNDLVESAQQAMDVLTALGDTAATTAEEIGKGMQKSAAAAHVAGVSYEELASMLTIITSKTQLGGAQAGTALNAIFNRMHRVAANKIAVGQDLESVSVNDVETALNAAGIASRDMSGNFRDTVDVLRDLAAVWEELNDVQKNAVMYAMAGGRQGNMFAQLMEGLSEDGGEEFDRLLGLAEDSEGTTETKYDIAIAGINGAIEQLKATWDQFVANLVSGDGWTALIDKISAIAAGFASIVSDGLQLGEILGAVVNIMGLLLAKTLATRAANYAMIAVEKQILLISSAIAAAMEKQAAAAALKAAAENGQKLGVGGAIAMAVALGGIALGIGAMVNGAIGGIASQGESYVTEAKQTVASKTTQETQNETLIRDYQRRIDRANRYRNIAEQIAQKYTEETWDDMSIADSAKLQSAINNMAASLNDVGTESQSAASSLQNFTEYLESAQNTISEYEENIKNLRIEQAQQAIRSAEENGTSYVPVSIEHGDLSYNNGFHAIERSGYDYFSMGLPVSISDLNRNLAFGNYQLLYDPDTDSYILGERGLNPFPSVLRFSATDGTGYMIDEADTDLSVRNATRGMTNGNELVTVLPDMTDYYGVWFGYHKTNYAELSEGQKQNVQRMTGILYENGVRQYFEQMLDEFNQSGHMFTGGKNGDGYDLAIEAMYELLNFPNISQGQQTNVARFFQQATTRQFFNDNDIINGLLRGNAADTSLALRGLNLEDKDTMMTLLDMAWLYADFIRNGSSGGFSYTGAYSMLEGDLYQNLLNAYGINNQQYMSAIAAKMENRYNAYANDDNELTDPNSVYSWVETFDIIASLLRDPAELYSILSNIGDFADQFSGTVNGKQFQFGLLSEDYSKEGILRQYRAYVQANNMQEDADFIQWLENDYDENTSREITHNGTNVNASISELVRNPRSAKDTGYRDLKQEFLHDVLAAGGDVEELDRLAASGKYSGMISQDGTLWDILHDLIYNPETTQYTYDDLIAHMTQAVYGKSISETVRSAQQSQQSLGNIRSIRNRLQNGNITWEDAQAIAEVTGQNAAIIMTNESARRTANVLYGRYEQEQTQSYESSIRSYADNLIASVLGSDLQYYIPGHSARQENAGAGLLRQGARQRARGGDEKSQQVYDLINELSEYGIITTLENGQLKFDYSHVADNVSALPEWVNYADFQRAFSISQLGSWTQRAMQMQANGFSWTNIMKELNEDGVSAEALALLNNDSDLKRYVQLQERLRELRAINEADRTPDQLAEIESIENELESLGGNLNIKYTVQGIQQLEEVGALLQGTADLVERLNKQGVIRIQAQFQAIGQAGQNANLIAMLNSGNTREREEAIASLAGVSWETYDQNRVLMNLLVPNLGNTTEQSTIASMNEWINLFARDNPGVSIAQIESALDQIGYRYNTNDEGKITITGLPSEIKNASPFLQLQRQYSAVDFAEAINDYGYIQTDDNELKQAIAQSGDYTHLAQRQRLFEEAINARREVELARQTGDSEALDDAIARRDAANDALARYEARYDAEIKNEAALVKLRAGVERHEISESALNTFASLTTGTAYDRQLAAVNAAGTLRSASVQSTMLGMESQQDRVAMEILGMDAATYYSNREQNLLLAQRINEQSVQQERTNAEAVLNGLKNEEDRNNYIASLEAAGYTVQGRPGQYKIEGEPTYNPNAAYLDYQRAFTTSETNALKRRLLDSGKTWNEINNEVTPDELEQLQNDEEFKRLMMLRERQRTGQLSLDELEEMNRLESSIRLRVSGLQELEQAGKVLEGTYALVENLNKSGLIKIKAEIEVITNIQSGANLIAMYNSNDPEQRRKAIMQMIGIDDRNAYEAYAPLYDMFAEQYVAENQRLLIEQANTALETMLQGMTEEEQEEYIAALRNSGIGVEQVRTAENGAHTEMNGYRITQLPGSTISTNPYANAPREFTTHQINAALATWTREGGFGEDVSDEMLQAIYNKGLTHLNMYERLRYNMEQAVGTEGFADALKEFNDFYKEYGDEIELEINIVGIQALEETGEVLEGTADLIQKLNKNGLIKIRAQFEAIGNASDMANLIAQANGTDVHNREQAIAQLAGVSWETYDANREIYNLLVPQLLQQAAELQADQLTQSLNQQIQQGDYQVDQLVPILTRLGYNVQADEGKIRVISLPTSERNTNPFLSVSRPVTTQEIADAFDENGNIREGTRQEVREAIASNGAYSHYAYAQRLSAEKRNASRTLGVSIRDNGVRSRQTLDARDAFLAADRAYKDYMSQYGDIIQAEEAQAVVSGLEAAGGVLSGAADVARYIREGSGTAEQQRTARSTMQGWIDTYTQSQLDIQALSGYAGSTEMWNLYGRQRVQELGQRLGFTEDEVAYYSDRRNFSELQNKVQERGQELQQTIMKTLGAAFHIDTSTFDNLGSMLSSLENSEDEAAQGAATLIRTLLELAGVQVDASGAVSDVRHELTGSSLYDSASGAQEYQQTQEDRGVRNFIAEQVRNGVTSYNDLASNLRQQYGWSQEDVTAFFDRNRDVADIFARGESEEPAIDVDANANPLLGAIANASTDRVIDSEMAQDIIETSDLGAMYHDTAFSRGYNQYIGLLTGGIQQNEVEDLLRSSDGEDFREWIAQFEDGSRALEELQTNGSISAETMARLNAQVTSGKIKDLRRFGEYTDEVAESMENMAKGGRAAANESIRYTQQIRRLNNAMVAADRARGKSGKQLSSEDRSQLAEASGLSEDDLKSMTAEEINRVADLVQQSASDEFANSVGGKIMAGLQTAVANYINANGSLDIDLNSFDIDSSGNFDLSEIAMIAQALGDEALATMAAQAGTIGELVVQLTESGNSLLAELVFSQLTGKGGYSGKKGGGGGGKSDAQKLIERLEREKKMLDHRLKMLQYDESFYENRGEYTNLNSLLQHEEVDLRTELIEQYQNSIDELLAQMGKTKKGQDDWYTLRDAVLSYEEAIEECENAIDEINRKLIENQQKTRKTRIELEGTIDAEIKNRIQRERDMLDGTVNMQNEILEAIKARYQEEWDLVTKDIEKKRQALEEEKNLIAERLNQRKEAADEAEKYEELAELKRQYALISMDSTRTKDAAEMRDKIAKLEEELAWSYAENEAEAQQESLQDQIDAYDQFVEIGGENLEYLLADAHNFAEELNQVLREDQTVLFDWLKENVKEYARSLEEMQKQMVNSWTDTYKQMWGITDTYWDFINQVLMSEEEFIAYMKESQDYINASETDKAYMEQEWRTAYQDYVSAYLDSGVSWSHTDDFDQYGTNGDSGGSGSGRPVSGYDVTYGQKTRRATTRQEATQLAIQMMQDWKHQMEETLYTSYSGTMDPTSLNQFIANYIRTTMASMGAPTITPVYKNGGLVDFTGPAWVDGTPSQPEAFLSAEDTALIRSWLDAAKYARVKPFMSSIDSTRFSNNGNSIGDVTITINEATINDDADVEALAQRVGDAFVRELSKTGFNTLNYSF